MPLPLQANKTFLPTTGTSSTSGNSCLTGILWKSVVKLVQSVEWRVQSVEWQTLRLDGVMSRKLLV